MAVCHDDGDDDDDNGAGAALRDGDEEAEVWPGKRP